MKKNIYVFIIIISIGYNVPTQSMLKRYAKAIKNKFRRFGKKPYVKTTRSYNSFSPQFLNKKNKNTGVYPLDHSQSSTNLFEKFTNFTQGYGFKSTYDIFLDTFKNDNVKNMEYALSRDPQLMVELFYVDGFGYLTPFEMAAWTKNFKVAKKLLEKGAFKDRTLGYGRNQKDIPNALTIGIMYLNQGENKSEITFYPNDVEVVQFLLESGIDIDQTTEYGATPLMLAAKYGQKNLVKFLLEMGADERKWVNVKLAGNPYKYGANASELAREYGHPEVAELMANYRKEKKDTFLSAIKSGQKDLVESLIKKDPGIINEGFYMVIEGQDASAFPETVAKKYGQVEIAKLISKIRTEQEKKEMEKTEKIMKQIIKD